MKTGKIYVYMALVLVSVCACQIASVVESPALPTPSANALPTLPTMQKKRANAPAFHASESKEKEVVSITAETVNLRTLSSGIASGNYLSRGDVVSVLWRDDNYGTIIAPTEYVGFMVWRGCTSDAGNLGCEAK